MKGFSGQQFQVLRLRRSGITNQEIAALTGIGQEDIELIISAEAERPATFERAPRFWTKERTEVLRSLVQQGFNSTEIAKEIPEATAVAIRNQVRCLGLSISRESGWTTDREDKLRELWADGLSASRIAKRLGGVTRNAVIGKVNRLGLPGRVVAERKPYSRSAKRPRKAQQKKRSVRGHFKPLADIHAPLPEIDDSAIPAEQRKTFSELENHHCKWPIGDPKDADFSFCGGKKEPGIPYCKEHAQRAFQGPQTRIRYADRKAYEQLQAAELKNRPQRGPGAVGGVGSPRGAYRETKYQ